VGLAAKGLEPFVTKLLQFEQQWRVVPSTKCHTVVRAHSARRCVACHSTQCYSKRVRRVFKTRTFARWCRKAALPDVTLCSAVAEMVAGLIDANLGGNVYKKRVPVPGRGKRGGARTLIGTNLGDRWFFLFGFEKNERATIDPRELAALQKVAGALLAQDTTGLGREIAEGELTAICREEKSPAH